MKRETVPAALMVEIRTWYLVPGMFYQVYNYYSCIGVNSLSYYYYVVLCSEYIMSIISGRSRHKITGTP